MGASGIMPSSSRCWDWPLFVSHTKQVFCFCISVQNTDSVSQYFHICLSGWIWSRESQREIQKVKAQYEEDVSTIRSEMEERYRETLTERRRAAATLELELEKERQRVTGYKRALISHSQQLMEERKQLQQVTPVNLWDCPLIVLLFI